MSDTKKTGKAAGTAYEDTYKEKATSNMVAKHTKADMQVVYIGPELKNIISRNTIFKNGIPTEIEEKLSEMPPVIKKMFIPVKKLPEAVKSLETDGAYKALYDNAVKALLKEGSSYGK